MSEIQKRFVLKIGQVHTYGEGKDFEWVRCALSPDGTIHLWSGKKVINDGKTIVPNDDARWDHILRPTFPTPPGVDAGMVSFLWRPGLFLSLHQIVDYRSPGVYHSRAWRSTDDLRTVKEIPVVLNVPDGPTRKRIPGEWYGLYWWRSIIEMPDGSLLATIEGNFYSDRVVPTGRRNQAETHSEDSYKLRTAVMRSTDGGETWDYLSTVAYPQPDDDAVGEGFGEPTMIRLDNGHLLCVMRSGNYTPLYSAWSSDEGRTWSGPVYTGLERGLDPCLLKLADGRVLLSYGMRYPAGSRGGPGETGPGRDRGEALVKLAISHNGTGKDWQETTIGRGMGSVYSTIFEVEPNIILCQVDGWIWRVMIMPRIPDTL